MKPEIKKTDLFHVHTYRCGHAADATDEEYIQKAIVLEATGIWFTEHVPFPGDALPYRMPYSQYEEYLTTLHELKKKYEKDITIHVGFEAEYFPSFAKTGYYDKLREDKRIEVLLLGQHMAEAAPGDFTHTWDKAKLAEVEHELLTESICAGMESGYFDILAHPDRNYRRRTVWNEDMEKTARMMKETALKTGTPLEQNEASMREENLYWEEF